MHCAAILKSAVSKLRIHHMSSHTCMFILNFMDSSQITLISGEELARLHGYASVTSQCRSWWRSLGITPLPGRKNIYDPIQVRERLNEAGGLCAAKTVHECDTVSLVDQRKARKYAQRQSS